MGTRGFDKVKSSRCDSCSRCVVDVTPHKIMKLLRTERDLCVIVRGDLITWFSGVNIVDDNVMSQCQKVGHTCQSAKEASTRR